MVAVMISTWLTAASIAWRSLTLAVGPWVQLGRSTP
jgi:hypothetical protein